MEITSYLLGKKSGGGEEPTGTINITSNGTKNVKNYATANVNVQPDLETKSITITENTTTTITPTSGKDGMSSVSITTSVGGSDIAPDNDVNFYDYDGTIVKSYTKNDFLNLASMPDNPTHEGLTSQGWNFTIEDAKNYVSKYGFVEIGQLYKPSDDKIHIFTILDNNNKSPYVGFAIDGTATIEWGDGTSDNVSGSSTSTMLYTQHTYLTGGKYEIKIFSTSNIYLSGNSNTSYLLADSTTPSTTNVYKDTIEKIYLSSNVYINSCSFTKQSNLKYIIISKDILGGSAFKTFSNCFSLIHINLMATNISNFKSCFAYCYSLKSVSVGGTNKLITDNAFGYCKSINKIMMFGSTSTSISNPFCAYSSIKKFAFDENITNISGALFEECVLLKEITFSKNLTTISSTSNMFNSCSSLNKLDFSKCTSIPTTSSITLNSSPRTYKIIVPDNLYENWIVASNWSTHASHIVKASEYIE